jgi:glutaredoxin 3
VIASVSRESAGDARVKVFGTANCGWCRRAEALLTREGIAFEKVDVTGDDEARAALVEDTGGRRTVPVIFVDGRAIGGYEELARLVAAHGL